MNTLANTASVLADKCRAAHSHVVVARLALQGEAAAARPCPGRLATLAVSLAKCQDAYDDAVSAEILFRSGAAV